LAGGYINYYYYGFVYVGSITKLLGVVPTVAYNLILPMLFSFTGLGAFSLAFNLVERRAKSEEQEEGLRSTFYPHRASLMAGFAAALLCVVLGNLGEVGVLADAWQRASDSTVNTGIAAVDTLARTVDGGLDVLLSGRPAPIGTGDWFWTATRAINIREGEVVPITEFPFFTFLYGDLHAHMIALPLALLALGWAVAVALEEGNSGQLRGTQGNSIPEAWLQWVVGALAIGVLWATNTWDLPTYLLLGVLAVVYRGWQRQGRFSLQGMGEAAVQSVALVALVIASFLPFNQNYGAGYTSLSLWPGTYTYLKNYLVIHGLFLFLVITHLARELRDWAGTWSREGLARWEPVARPLLVTLFAFVVLLLGLVIKDYWVAPVALTLSVVAGVLSLRPGLSSERRVALLLISCALALTLFVEIFVLDGDIGRMNTVFKFYMQVWVMLSVVGGAAFAWAWPAVSQRWGQTGRRVWQVSLGILVAAALLYPILATRAKWQVRMSEEAPTTLDGMVFMKTTEYGDTSWDGRPTTISLEYDYDALRWMQQNIEGSPVIAEGYSHNQPGFSTYRTITSRVAMYTGLPAIVGWDWHQRQQRAVVPGTLVSERVADVNLLYSTADVNQAMAILDKYGVKYVYAGQLEWVYYEPQGLLKFDQMVNMGLLREVYRNSGVSIYEVVE
jgi:YYY domain-containing protein